jgi:hypothetical protein
MTDELTTPTPTEDPQEIVGESEAGERAEQVRRRINKLIKAVNTNTFDLAEYLHEAKKKNYYSKWGFENFSAYAKSLNMKYVRAYYLVDIVETMRTAGVSRAEYEQVGVSKLRLIAKLDPEAEYKGTPVVMLIRELTLKAANMSQEEVQAEVEKIQGKVGDDSMVWMNMHIKKIARENVCKPAIGLIRKAIGSVGVDEDGNAIDASDGACFEMMCANTLTDPNFNPDAKPKTIPEQLLSLLESFTVPEDTTVKELIETLKSLTKPKEETDGDSDLGPSESEPSIDEVGASVQ